MPDNHIATRLIHAGSNRSAHAETSEALYLTSGFVYGSAEEAEAAFTGSNAHHQYSRLGNPTTAMLEGPLASINGAVAAIAARVGQPAPRTTALYALVRLVESQAAAAG